MSTQTHQKKPPRHRKAYEIRDSAFRWTFVGLLLAAYPGWSLYTTGVIAFLVGSLSAAVYWYSSHLLKPLEFDSSVDLLGTIKENDLCRYTSLGLAIPFQEWKQALSDIRQEYGEVTVELRKKATLSLVKIMRVLCLSDDNFTRHMAFLSKTGGGKTEHFKNILRQTIFKGGGCILVEGKSDSDFSGTALRYAEEAGRIDDVRIINLEQPQLSHTYNPLFGAGVRHLIAMIKTVQKESKEEFWNAISRYGIAATVLALKLQPGSRVFTIKDVCVILQDLKMLHKLIVNIDADESEDHQNGKEWLVIYYHRWMDDEGVPENRRYKEFMAGLASSLMGYTHSEYAKILNAVEPDVLIRDAIVGGKIVILSMSTLADRDGTALLGRMFIADLARVVGELQQEGEKPFAMCPAFFDEYGSFKDATQLDLFQLARSANVPLIISAQTKGLLEDNANATFATDVLGNVDTLIVSDIKENDTRDFVIKLAGEMLERLSQESSSESEAASASTAETRFVTQDTESTGVSVGTKESRTNLLEAKDFADLDPGDAIVVGKSGTYRLRGPLIDAGEKIPNWISMPLVRFAKRGVQGQNIWAKAYKALEREYINA